MVHGELEDQCQSHPAGVALSAGTNQVNHPPFLKSPTLRVLSCVSPFFYSKYGIQTRCVCSTGRGTDIISLRLRSAVVKASAVPSLCYFKFCLLSKKVSYFPPFCRNKKDSLVRLWAEQDQGEYRLQKDGSLQVCRDKIFNMVDSGPAGFYFYLSLQKGINLPDYASEEGAAVKNER